MTNTKQRFFLRTGPSCPQKSSLQGEQESIWLVITVLLDSLISMGEAGSNSDFDCDKGENKVNYWS